MKKVVYVLSFLVALVMVSNCCPDGNGKSDGPVIIAARLYVKSGSIGEFKRLAAPLIEATRQEKGCLQYDLYQDISDSTAFFFYEVYADRDAQELHSGSEYLARFIREREPLVCDESEVNVYDAEIRKQLK